MRKSTATVTYSCDDCGKEIATVEDKPYTEPDVLMFGIFRPKYGQGQDDYSELCKECMLKLLNKWREEVSGH